MAWGARVPESQGTTWLVGERQWKARAAPDHSSSVYRLHIHQHHSWSVCNCAPRDRQNGGMDNDLMCTKPRYIEASGWFMRKECTTEHWSFSGNIEKTNFRKQQRKRKENLLLLYIAICSFCSAWVRPQLEYCQQFGASHLKEDKD